MLISFTGTKLLHMADKINSNEIQIEQIETRFVPNYPKIEIFPQANNNKTGLFDSITNTYVMRK